MAKKITPRFPDYEWYCVDCHECLNNQPDFDDNKFTWKCTNCNYKNSISKDNLRKPYAYLKNPTPVNKLLSVLFITIRSLYGVVFRTAFYISVFACLVIITRQTTIAHLRWGMISPNGIEDYFCTALCCSWIVVIAMLLVYALYKRLTGKPDAKKHFVRETVLFFRDSFLYPIKTCKSIIKHTTMTDMFISIIAICIFVVTIGVLMYGSVNWL